MSKQAFTLIEILTVIIILSILINIAIPSYKKYILKARSEEAKSTIQTILFAQERYKQEIGEYFMPSTNNCYKNENNISNSLKIELYKSNNFVYWICKDIDINDNFIIKAYIRKDVDKCEDGSDLYSNCKDTKAIDVDSWIDSNENFNKNINYLSFSYPIKFDDGEFIENGIDYENFFD